MKRILALLLSLAFCLTAAACSLLPSKPEDTGKDTSSSTTPSLTPDPVTTPSITTDTPVTTPPEPVKTTAPPVTDPPSPHEPGRLQPRCGLERKDKCLHEIWHLSSLFELLRKNTVTLKQFSVTVSSSYVRV